MEAKIKESDSAFDTYSDTIASSRTAALLEKTKDIFKISLGQIPPGTFHFFLQTQ